MEIAAKTDSEPQLSALHEAAVRLVIGRCFERSMRPIELAAALTDGYDPQEVVRKLEKIMCFFRTDEGQVGELKPALTAQEWEKIIGRLGISAGDWVDLAERIQAAKLMGAFDRTPGYQEIIRRFYDHLGCSDAAPPLAEAAFHRSFESEHGGCGRPSEGCYAYDSRPLK